MLINSEIPSLNVRHWLNREKENRKFVMSPLREHGAVLGGKPYFPATPIGW
jgi:hypothetical protein